MSSLPGAAGVTVLSLLPLMNPIGALPAFYALTAGERIATRHAQARRTALYCACLLIVAAIAGRPLLHALGITLPALQIAGGLIVGHTAYGMVVNGPRLTENERRHSETQNDISFTPMAMPLLAGPGALGVVLGLASRTHGVAPMAGIVLGCLAIAVAVWVVLRGGEPLMARMGPTGIGALTRILGFLILAIAVELIVHGALSIAPGLRH
jgi:multiple antibiotic resistance protein